jgi:hypothetical protein
VKLFYGNPQAVRITRVGSTYTAYYSNDSFNWVTRLRSPSRVTVMQAANDRKLQDLAHLGRLYGARLG